ncbi:MAG: CocE/NonD family hydrolase [Bacteroidia bacterium]
MMRILPYSLKAIVLCLLTTQMLFAQKLSEPFEFQFENKTLRGLIEKPQDHPSPAIVILVPGYGKTNFVEGNWFSNLRDQLVASGLTVVLWDKMGCGNSEGEFDALQAVENSADEAIAAIKKIKSLEIVGSEKIGLWGISRAGWICPLINEQFPIDFWISVSGTDDKENYGYLLKSNLIIEGKEPEEAEKLYEAWLLGQKFICTQGSYEDYLAAVQPLIKDETCQRLFGYTAESDNPEEDRKAYLQQQKSYTSKGHFDPKSGLWVYIESFDQMLRNIDCPVLALFGEDDSQVDWRKTKTLYENTIGNSENPLTNLTIKVFEDCNHSLQKCISCAYQEDLSALNWQACDAYYETMLTWLKDQKIIE